MACLRVSVPLSRDADDDNPSFFCSVMEQNLNEKSTLNKLYD